jgi:hypothetical protein
MKGLDFIKVIFAQTRSRRTRVYHERLSRIYEEQLIARRLPQSGGDSA